MVALSVKCVNDSTSMWVEPKELLFIGDWRIYKASVLDLIHDNRFEQWMVAREKCEEVEMLNLWMANIISQWKML